MKLTWNEIVDGIGGRLIFGELKGQFFGVSTDTRTIKGGDLFIALKGENFDGHNFVQKAIEGGACGAVVSTELNSALRIPHSAFIIKVDDTLKALGDIAMLWREKHPIPVVAITGSNGKTTTKEMTASILSKRFTVLKTEGNLNNLIGLPQMVLKMDESHEAAVLELGMNAFGEIKRLSEICRPDVAIITNVGSGHLEGVGSIEGVARAKGEILEGLKGDGIFVMNADDPHIRDLAKAWRGRSLSFGLENQGADVKTFFADYSCCFGSGMKLSMTINGEHLDVTLPGLGRHNVYNATASAAIAFAMGAGVDEIKSGLEQWRPFKGRFELHRLDCGVNLIDDTYNANPSSTEMALKTLAEVKALGRGFAVLGDMLELGEHAEKAHYEIGKKAADNGVDYLFLIGPISTANTARGAMDGGMAPERVIVCNDYANVSEKVAPMLTGGDWILVKGSRGMAMEKVVEGLRNIIRPDSGSKCS